MVSYSPYAGPANVRATGAAIAAAGAEIDGRDIEGSDIEPSPSSN